MRRFSNLYSLLTLGAPFRGGASALENYFAQLDQSDAHWAFALLNGCTLPPIVAPRLLREWVVTLSGYPDWLVAACHEQSGVWLETLAKLMPTAGATEPPKLAMFMETQVFNLTNLNPRERRESVEACFPRLTEMERVLYMKWITGSFRPAKAVRGALDAAGIRPFPLPALLSSQPRQLNLLE